MGERLQRHIGSARDVKAGQWCNDLEHHTTGMMATIRIGCACGWVSTLSDKHVVSKTGEVTPAFKCQSDTCGFFDWITLDGWGVPT